MLLEYPRKTFRRGEAWHDLLHNRPDYVSEDGRYYFEVRQNGFRKSHTEEDWRWYVAKWCLRGEDILKEAPCEPPELDPELVDKWTQSYVWDWWVEHDGKMRCGFVLPYLVKSRCRPHEDSNCQICQEIGSWSPPRVKTKCERCKGSGEIDDPWDSLPTMTIMCPDCKGEGEV